MTFVERMTRWADLLRASLGRGRAASLVSFAAAAAL